MFPQGASLTPSISRPRIVPMPASLPVPLHVTSSRKVHRSADGIINIIQEISFYADGNAKSLAGKLLNEVHSQPEAQMRGRFSAETNARVFVGERLIRMHIQTSIRPNSSDSLEIDEVFHFAEHQDALLVPIAFEATLERTEEESPAVEFDLSSPIVVTLKQRILKDAGEQYKVMQAIELRANEVDTRPTQELARKSTISQPSNETAQFRERIFVGTDVLRVDRDIAFVCDRQILSLSERREYMPSYPSAPRRRSSSLTQSASRVRHTPEKPRSRSQSRSWAEDSDNCHTAREDLPTAISPYSLREDASTSFMRTARDVSPLSSCLDSDRESRSKRKKWTVNSATAKAVVATPDRYDRARTMRSLSTARNLSFSPLPTARSPNGEIPAVQAIPIVPNTELGPHGECTLVEGMEVLKVADPVDSLIRTCNEGRSPTRSRSSCSTASKIPSSVNNNACESPPFSPIQSMPGTAESSNPSTPIRTVTDRSPHRRAPSSAALNKRRGLFGYGARPVTSPMRTARRSPSHPVKTGLQESPMKVQTAVVARSNNNSHHSRKSQKASHKESKHSGKSSKSRRVPLADLPITVPSSVSSSTNVGTARNLFGTASPNESKVSRALFTGRNRTPDSHPRTGRETSRRSPPLATAYTRSISVSPDHHETGQDSGEKTDEPRTARAHSYHDGTISARSPSQSINTARHGSSYEKSALWSHASQTARGHTDRSPDRSPLVGKSACSPALHTATLSPYEHNVTTAHSARSPARSMKTGRDRSPYAESTARSSSHASLARCLPTARGYEDKSPAPIKTARDGSPYGTTTARETRTPARTMKTSRDRSPYERTARSPADGVRTAAEYGRSPSLTTARPPVHSPGTRSLYLAPEMMRENAVPPAGDPAYTHHVTTARAASRTPSQDDLNSTKSCISGGVDSDARWTARSGPRTPPSMMTSRDESPSPLRTGRSGNAVSRTQSMTRSDASNMVTALGGRSLHVDAGSPTRDLKTIRKLHSPRTARALSVDRGAASPANLKTAREVRSAASQSPSARQLHTATTRTPEHNTMPDSHLRQEDSYSEQSQFTYTKTPSGYTQKPTHSSETRTGRLQHTPTKTDTNSTLYYSARQTTPYRTLRPDDITLTQRTPKRDYSQHADLEQPSPIRTGVDNTPSKKQCPKMDEMPKCSLKTGCQMAHAPRKIPAGPESDGQDSPSRRAVSPKTPERSLRTARGPTHTPSAPYGDMRTPRTARASRASPASSFYRSPVPSSHMITAVSPDAVSNSDNSNDDVATARHQLRRPSSPRSTTARNWAAATERPPTSATSKPRVILRANQADGKIHVEVSISFKMNTTGTIRVRGEMASALQPRTVSVNGQQIWSSRI